MAVVGMEREEAEIVRAFLEYPCLVPAEFEQDVCPVYRLLCTCESLSYTCM